MNQGALYLDTLIRTIELFRLSSSGISLTGVLIVKSLFFKQRLYLPENHGILYLPKATMAPSKWKDSCRESLCPHQIRFTYPSPLQRGRLPAEVKRKL